MNIPKLKLYLTPRSPFARRIRLALERNQISYEKIMVDPFEPTKEFLDASPFGLVPALTRENQNSLPDSHLILEWIDQHTQNIWPKNVEDRIEAQHFSLLCTGVMRGTVDYFLESQRKAPDQIWMEDYHSTVERTLPLLNQKVTLTKKYTQCLWDLGVVLEYLDLRLPRLDWRKKYPNFLAVLSECQNAPEFKESKPPQPA